MEPGKFEQKLENAISAYLDLCERNASEDEIRKNLAQSLHASYWREKIYLPAPDFWVHFGRGLENYQFSYTEEHSPEWKNVVDERKKNYPQGCEKDSVIAISVNNRDKTIGLSFTPYLQIPNRTEADYKGVWVSPKGPHGLTLWSNESEYGDILADLPECGFVFSKKPIGSTKSLKGGVDFQGRIGGIRIETPLKREDAWKKELNLNSWAYLGDGTLTAFFKHVGYDGLEKLANL